MFGWKLGGFLSWITLSLLAQAIACGLLFANESQAQEVRRNDLQFQVFQSEYLSEPQNQTQGYAYSSLGARYRTISRSAPSMFGIDVMGLGSVDGAEHGYLALPEAFAGYENEESGLQLVVGRQRFLWSQFDEEWRLGIWQPYVRWDYLNPKPQGLTGFFAGFKGRDVAVNFFATPLFLPDQGPQFVVQDGEFHSSNRWFRQPQNRHMVIGQDRRLNYVLDKPAEKDLFLNAGVGLSVAVGDENQGPWLKTSLANKPINQLRLGIEGYHSLNPADHLYESMAVVHPLVARHTVTTVEAGYHGEDFLAWASVTEERPDRTKVPEDWEESALKAARFYGGAVRHRLPWAGFRNQWLKYAYLDIQEDASGVNSRAPGEDQLESSLDRYPYRQVVSVEWTAPLISRVERRLDVGIRYLYSIPERGSLLSAKMEFNWDLHTRWDLGFDVLGADTPPESDKAGMMSLYRNNDRVMGGMTYVF